MTSIDKSSSSDSGDTSSCTDGGSNSCDKKISGM